MIICITGASSGIGEATAARLAREPGAQLVLVARREERLAALAARLPGGPHTYVSVDLTDDDAPSRVRAHVEAEHGGELNVLVNNAGSSWRSTFADGGWENMRRTMELNFNAQVRLTEALLPLLRESQPAAVVNVSSTAARVSRQASGAYSASKAALVGWTDALWAEERPHGVHVGLVLPGFITTEGFPQAELTAKASTRWMVSTPEKGAEAIAQCALNGKAERYVPRAYWIFAALRILAPTLMRQSIGGRAGQAVATTTRPDGK